MRPHWHNEHGEPLCELHAPDVEGDLNSNETDVPENCVVCGRLCEYSLTPDGVAYVFRYVREAVAQWPAGEEKRTNDPDGFYYADSRLVDVVRDWAQDLADGYALTPAEHDELSAFLALTE